MGWFRRKADAGAASLGQAPEDATKKGLLRHEEADGRLPEVSARQYFANALVLVVVLVVIGLNAEHLPAAVFPIVFLLYALPSTFGAMYDVVVRRFHNQAKFNEGGRLSRLNRSWPVLLALCFCLSLASAFFFFLKSPAWGLPEWLLLVVGVPLYFIVFRLAAYVSKKEYSPVFFKTRAITFSTWVVGLFLCVVYVLVTTDFSPEVVPNLSETLRVLDGPFKDSSSALMVEADKLNTCSYKLTQHGLMQIQAASFALALLIKVVLSMSVFLGFASQLGACVLGWKEIRAEFQLLPADAKGELAEDEPTEDGSLKKRYLAVLISIFMVFSAAFLGVDRVLAKQGDGGEPTKVDMLLDGVTSDIVVVDLWEEYRYGANDLKQQYEGALKESVNEYYDACLENVDSYLDQRGGILEELTSLLKPVGGWFAMRGFEESVIDSTDRSELDVLYQEYAAGLRQLWGEYMDGFDSVVGERGGDQSVSGGLTNSNLSAEVEPLDLWPLMDEDEGKALRTALLGDASEEELEAKIDAFIESNRTATLASVDAMAKESRDAF